MRPLPALLRIRSAVLPAVALALALTGCQSSADGAGAAAEPAAHAYTWVWLLTGPRDAELQGDARTQAFQGHFANIQRLADEGTLVLAGPLGPPKARAEHRGVFILDTADPDAARAATQRDPTVQAGVFVMELQPFRTDADLGRIPEMHRAAVAATGVVDPEPGFHARPYVLLTGAPAVSAEQALQARAGGPAVLFHGRLGGGADEQALFCLDLREPQQAAAGLAESVRWTVIPWFATEEVAVLGGPSAPGGAR